MAKQTKLEKIKNIKEVLKTKIPTKYKHNDLIISGLGIESNKYHIKKNAILFSGMTGNVIGIANKTLFSPFKPENIFKNISFSRIKFIGDEIIENDENGLVITKEKQLTIRPFSDWMAEQNITKHTLIIFVKENQVQFIRVEGDYREFNHLDTSITHFKENEAAFIDKLKTWDRWDDDVNIVNAKNYHYAIVIY